MVNPRSYTYERQSQANPFRTSPSGSQWARKELEWLGVYIEYDKLVATVIETKDGWMPRGVGRFSQKAIACFNRAEKQLISRRRGEKFSVFYETLGAYLAPDYPADNLDRIASSATRPSSTPGTVVEVPRKNVIVTPARKLDFTKPDIEAHALQTPSTGSSSGYGVLQSSPTLDRRKSRAAVSEPHALRTPSTPRVSGSGYGVSQSGPTLDPITPRPPVSKPHGAPRIQPPVSNSIEGDFSSQTNPAGSDPDDSDYADKPPKPKEEVEVQAVVMAYLSACTRMLEQCMEEAGVFDAFKEIQLKQNRRYEIKIDKFLMTTKPDICLHTNIPIPVPKYAGSVETIMVEVKKEIAVNESAKERVLGQEVCHMLSYATRKLFAEKDKVTVYLVSWHQTTAYFSSLEITKSQLLWLQDTEHPCPEKIQVKRSVKFDLKDQLFQQRFANGLTCVLLATLEQFNRYQRPRGQGVVEMFKAACDA